MVIRIKELTKKQEDLMPMWAEKWIAIGLRTGEMDFETFNKYMKVCYEKTGLVYPKRVIRVPSPFFGAHVASLAHEMWEKRYKNSVRESVSSSVEVSVSASVLDSVSSSVGASVGVTNYEKQIVKTIQKLSKEYTVTPSWNYWFAGQFWVGYWWHGVAYVDFLLTACELELSKDMMERAEAYRKVCESVNYIWPNRDFILVCERPIKIDRNADGRLHCINDMAIKWPDGWGLYMLNGVRFDEELFKKVTSGTMPFKDILAIENADQRSQAFRFGDPFDFVKHEGAKLLDTHSKFGLDGREVKYWLYEFAAGKTFTETVHYMIYDDSMDTAGKKHMQGVIETKTVAEAMAWKQHITPELWLSLQLDVDFT
jgi:hypothetical protein